MTGTEPQAKAGVPKGNTGGHWDRDVRECLSWGSGRGDFELIAHVFGPARLHGDLTDFTSFLVGVHVATQSGLCIEGDDQHVFDTG